MAIYIPVLLIDQNDRLDLYVCVSELVFTENILYIKNILYIYI